MKHSVIVVLVLAMGLLFRLYHIPQLYQFNHEQDLQAWIIKDIVIDHHWRLIGQETSITGVFIGPLYYYILAGFFIFGHMHPLSAVAPVTMFAILTLISVYYVFSRLFNRTTGVIGAFIYAVSTPIVFLDRWAVPTQPTLLWTIWFFYCLFMIARGKFSTLPILIVLVGFIWYVHVAFIPLLLLVPVAVLLSRKPIFSFLSQLITKSSLLAMIITVVLLTPFFAFEFRHGFTQIRSILTATHEGTTVIHGRYKQEIILKNIDKQLTAFIFQNSNLPLPKVWIIPSSLILFVVLLFYLHRSSRLQTAELLLLLFWIGDIIITHTISIRPIEDYYFNHLVIVSLAVFSLLFAHLYSYHRLRVGLLIFGDIFLFYHFFHLFARPTSYNEYYDKSQAVSYINIDRLENQYPCVAITYIGPPGTGYGFRYLFWYNGVNLITPGEGVPVYNVVIPAEISGDEINRTFGLIGVILPQNPPVDTSVCTDPSRQLLPLNGFVN